MSQNLSLIQAKLELLNEITKDFKSCEFEDNPKANYIEGRKTENDRLTIIIQQKWMAMLEQKHREEKIGLECCPLLFPKYFPKNHKKAGQETHFSRRMMQERMIHVFRKDYAYWLNAVQKVKNGEAYISVMEWEQNKTETQKEVLRLDASSGIEIQKIHYERKQFYLRRTRLCNLQLAENAGFNTETDFLNYYKPFPKSELALIQFTGFRY